MAIKAVNLSKTIDYQSDYDPEKGTDKATVATLGAIDTRVLGIIKDKATAIPVSSFSTGEGMATLNYNAMNFDVVQFGLKNIVRFDVPYKTTIRILGQKQYVVADDSVVAALPEEVLSEYAGKILEINSLSEEERKNSEE